MGMTSTTLEENRVIIYELTQGKELAAQLQSQIGSPEACEPLLEKLISCYDKAITLLNFNLFFGGHLGNTSSVCPTSAASEADSSKLQQCHREVFKKRKTCTKWSEQVRVFAVGGNLDDGHSWRKYGQKDILGANHPRAYYRCTHRFTQGCLATKLLQRSDGDPSIFEVTYKGRHSCKATHPAMISGEVGRPKPRFQPQKQGQSHDLVLNYGLDQKLGSPDIGNGILPPFSFVPTPITAEKENNLLESCYPPLFPSPTSPEEPMNSSFLLGQKDDDFGLSQILDNSESDLIDEIILTPTSVMNSPFVDWELPADQVNLDVTDILEYFS